MAREASFAGCCAGGCSVNRGPHMRPNCPASVGDSTVACEAIRQGSTPWWGTGERSSRAQGVMVAYVPLKN